MELFASFNQDGILLLFILYLYFFVGQADPHSQPICKELLLTFVQLKQEVSNLRRITFGQKTERFVPVSSDQIVQSILGALSGGSRKVESIYYNRRKSDKAKVLRHSRFQFPTHLAWIEIIL